MLNLFQHLIESIA